MVENKNTPPVLLIILSACSFIPFFGIFFGVLSVIIGLIDFSRFRLIFILGVSGIGLTLLLAGSIFFMSKLLFNSDSVVRVKTEATEIFLSNLSGELENYKCMHGSYPDSLGKVSSSNNMIVTTDMFNTDYVKGNDKNRTKVPEFYYRAENDTFVLFSVGRDGKAFTKDDIFPKKMRVPRNR